MSFIDGSSLENTGGAFAFVATGAAALSVGKVAYDHKKSIEKYAKIGKTIGSSLAHYANTARILGLGPSTVPRLEFFSEAPGEYIRYGNYNPAKNRIRININQATVDTLPNGVRGLMAHEMYHAFQHREGVNRIITDINDPAWGKSTQRTRMGRYSAAEYVSEHEAFYFEEKYSRNLLSMSAPGGTEKLINRQLTESYGIARMESRWGPVAPPRDFSRARAVAGRAGIGLILGYLGYSIFKNAKDLTKDPIGFFTGTAASAAINLPPDKPRNFLGVTTSPYDYEYVRFNSADLYDETGKGKSMFSIDVSATNWGEDFNTLVKGMRNIRDKTHKKILLELRVHGAAAETHGVFNVHDAKGGDNISPLRLIRLLKEQGFDKSNLTIVSDACNTDQVFGRTVKQYKTDLEKIKRNPKIYKDAETAQKEIIAINTSLDLLDDMEIVGINALDYGHGTLRAFLMGSIQTNKTTLRRITGTNLKDPPRVVVPPPSNEDYYSRGRFFESFAQKLDQTKKQKRKALLARAGSIYQDIADSYVDGADPWSVAMADIGHLLLGNLDTVESNLGSIQTGAAVAAGALGAFFAFNKFRTFRPVKSKIPAINLLHSVTPEQAISSIIETESSSRFNLPVGSKEGAYAHWMRPSGTVSFGNRGLPLKVIKQKHKFAGPGAVTSSVGSVSDVLSGHGTTSNVKTTFSPFSIARPTPMPFGIDTTVGHYQIPFSIDTPRPVPLEPIGPMPFGADATPDSYPARTVSSPEFPRLSRAEAAAANASVAAAGLSTSPISHDPRLVGPVTGHGAVTFNGPGSVSLGPVGIHQEPFHHPSRVETGFGFSRVGSVSYGQPIPIANTATGAVIDEAVTRETVSTPVAGRASKATAAIESRPVDISRFGRIAAIASLVTMFGIGVAAGLAVSTNMQTAQSGGGGTKPPSNYPPTGLTPSQPPSGPRPKSHVSSPVTSVPLVGAAVTPVEGQVMSQGQAAVKILDRIDASRPGDVISTAVYAIKDNLLVKKLIEAHRRGVEVNILAGRIDPDQKKLLELAGINPTVMTREIKAGGGTEYMHAKAFAFIPASGQPTVIGYTGNAELNYYHNPARRRISAPFGGVTKERIPYDFGSSGTSDSGYVVDSKPFAEQIDKLVRRPSMAPELAEVATGWMLLTPNSEKNQLALAGIVGMINRAKTTIDISSMQLSDGQILNALLAAKSRGVDIKATIAGNTAEPGVIKKLAEAGIELKQLPEWKGFFMHNKLLVTDTEAYVGSAAMADRTFKYNVETGVFLKGKAVRQAQAIAKLDWEMGNPLKLYTPSRYDSFILDQFMPAHSADAKRVKYMVNPAISGWIKDLAIQNGTIQQLEAAPSIGTYMYTALWSASHGGMLRDMGTIPGAVTDFDKLIAARTWGNTWLNMGSMLGIDFSFQQVGNRGPIDSFLVRLGRSIDRVTTGEESGRVDPYTGESTDAKPVEHLFRSVFDFTQNTTLNIGAYYYWTLPVLRAKVYGRQALLRGASIGAIKWDGIENIARSYEATRGVEGGLKAAVTRPGAGSAWVFNYFFGKRWDRFWNRFAGEMSESVLLPVAKQLDPVMGASKYVERIAEMYYSPSAPIKGDNGRILDSGGMARTYAKSTELSYRLSDEWMKTHPVLRAISSAGIGRYFLAYGPGHIWDQSKSMLEAGAHWWDLRQQLDKNLRGDLYRVGLKHAEAAIKETFGMRKSAAAARAEARNIWWGEKFLAAPEGDPVRDAIRSKSHDLDGSLREIVNRRRVAWNTAIGFNPEEGFLVRHYNAGLARVVAFGVPTLILNKWAGELGAATRADMIDQRKFLSAINRLDHQDRRDLDLHWTAGLPWWATPAGNLTKDSNWVAKVGASVIDTLPLIAGTAWYNAQKYMAMWASFSRLKSLSKDRVAQDAVLGQAGYMLGSRALAEPFAPPPTPMTPEMLERIRYAQLTGDLRTANYLYTVAASGPGPGVSEFGARETTAFAIQFTGMPMIMTPSLGIFTLGDTATIGLSLQGPVALQAGFTLASPLGLKQDSNPDLADLKGLDWLLAPMGMGQLTGYSFGYVPNTSGEALFKVGADITAIHVGLGALGKTPLGKAFKTSYAYDLVSPVRTALGIVPNMIPSTISGLANVKQWMGDNSYLKHMGINHGTFGELNFEFRDQILASKDPKKRVDAIMKVLQQITDNQELYEAATKSKARAGWFTKDKVPSMLSEFLQTHKAGYTVEDINRSFGAILREESAGAALNNKLWSRMGKAVAWGAAGYLLLDLGLSLWGSVDQRGASAAYKSIQNIFSGNKDTGWVGLNNYYSHNIKPNWQAQLTIGTLAGGAIGHALGRKMPLFGNIRAGGVVGLVAGLAAGAYAYKPISSLIGGGISTGLGLVGALFDVSAKTNRPKSVFEEADFDEDPSDPRQVQRPATEVGFMERHLGRFGDVKDTLYYGVQALFTGLSNIGFIKDYMDDNTVMYNKTAVYFDFGGVQFVGARGLAGAKRNIERSNLIANFVSRGLINPSDPNRTSTRLRPAAIGKMWHSQSPTNQASFAVSLQLRQRMEETKWILATDPADAAYWYFGRGTTKRSDNVMPGLMGRAESMFPGIRKGLARYIGSEDMAGYYKFNFFQQSHKTRKFYKYFKQLTEDAFGTGELAEMAEFDDYWTNETNTYGAESGIGKSYQDYQNEMLSSDWKTRLALGVSAATIGGVGLYAGYQFLGGKTPGKLKASDMVSLVLNGDKKAPKMGFIGVNPTWDNAGMAINGYGNKIYQRGALVIGESLWVFGSQDLEYGNPLRATKQPWAGRIDYRVFQNTLKYAARLGGGQGLGQLRSSLDVLAEVGIGANVNDPARNLVQVRESLKEISTSVRYLSENLDTQLAMLDKAISELERGPKTAFTEMKIKDLIAAKEGTRTFHRELLMSEEAGATNYKGKINPIKELLKIQGELEKVLEEERLKIGPKATLSPAEELKATIKFLEQTNVRHGVKNSQILKAFMDHTGNKLITMMDPIKVATQFGFTAAQDTNVVKLFGHKILTNSKWAGLLKALELVETSWFGLRSRWDEAREHVRTRGTIGLVAELDVAMAKTHQGVMGSAKSGDLISMFHEYQLDRIARGEAINAGNMAEEFARFAAIKMGEAGADIDPHWYDKLSGEEKIRFEKYSKMISGKDRLGIAATFAGRAALAPFRMLIPAAGVALQLPMAATLASPVASTLYMTSVALNDTETPDRRYEAAVGAIKSAPETAVPFIGVGLTGIAATYLTGTGASVKAAADASAIRKWYRLKQAAGIVTHGKAGLQAIGASLKGARFFMTGMTTTFAMGGGEAALPFLASLAVSVAAVSAVEAAYNGVDMWGIKFEGFRKTAERAIESIADPETILNWSDPSWRDGGKGKPGLLATATRVAVTAMSMPFRVWQAGMDVSLGRWASWETDPTKTPAEQWAGTVAKYAHYFFSPIIRNDKAANIWSPQITGMSLSLRSSILAKSPIWYGNMTDFSHSQVLEQDRAMLGDPELLLNRFFHDSTFGRESDQAVMTSMPKRATIWKYFQPASLISESIGLIMKARALESQPLLFQLNDRSGVWGGTIKEGVVEKSGYHTTDYFLRQDAIKYEGKAWGQDFVQGNNLKAGPRSGLYTGFFYMAPIKGADGKRLAAWDPYIREASELTGIDPNLLRATLMIESNGAAPGKRGIRGRIVPWENNERAVGPMQFMPSTWKGLANSKVLQSLVGSNPDPEDPRTAMIAAALLFKQKLSSYGNLPRKGVAGEKVYNDIQKMAYWYGEQSDAYVQKVWNKYLEYTRQSRVPVTSPFGRRQRPTAGASDDHPGADYGVGRFTRAYAVAEGKVVYAGPAGGYGNLATYQFNVGKDIIQVSMAHMNSLNVSPGDTVKPGQLIGLTGSTGISTGPHAHIEVRINGKLVDPESTPFGQATFSSGIIIPKVTDEVAKLKPKKPKPTRKPKSKPKDPKLSGKVTYIALGKERQAVPVDNAKRAQLPIPTVAQIDSSLKLASLTWFDGDEYMPANDNAMSCKSQSYDDYFRA